AEPFGLGRRERLEVSRKADAGRRRSTQKQLGDLHSEWVQKELVQAVGHVDTGDRKGSRVCVRHCWCVDGSYPDVHKSRKRVGASTVLPAYHQEQLQLVLRSEMRRRTQQDPQTFR